MTPEDEARCIVDRALEHGINFFLGLWLDEGGPDATTICRFRSRLIVND